MHNNQTDPYLYHDVPVLKNKLGIKDDELLAKAESAKPKRCNKKEPDTT